MHSSPITELKVVGAATILVKAPKSCGYSVSPYGNTVRVPYTGCHVDALKGQYILKVSYITEHGRLMDATLSCADGTNVTDMLNPRADEAPSTTNFADSTTAMAQNQLDPRGSIPPPTCRRKAQNCDVAVEEQIQCGHNGISKEDCDRNGCCSGDATYKCHYPLDECTVDNFFVFAIRKDSASIPIDPRRLIIPNYPHCVPIIVKSHFAIYKIPLADCGVRSYMIGHTSIFMVEVHTVVEALDLKYGVIAREDAFRFMIECRYPQTGSCGLSWASVGYKVRVPMLQLPVILSSHGRYSVQLRLARDASFDSYYSKDSLPLSSILGSPVFLEVNLLEDVAVLGWGYKPILKPRMAVLVVNYCLAFPRNANKVLVLVYEGCANPNDPGISILSTRGHGSSKQKRFLVKAFQFMNVQTNTYLQEEIFFMCSTEVCLNKRRCDRGCFAGS
ncbi:zona pellucida sperm-binding protein 4-like [Gadus macrocephalus]|uniref:zona pellucida sperm-binding protein 4-like n=1 Tax=Gadus macrocephalus TaxID=80720 RepID=UPI0028CB88BD|nr:zona pellucida sperm-binding protein 4-like [Gadus macrocephalus]